MNKTRISRFLLAVVLLVVAALSVVACEKTTYKINVTCDSAKGTYELAPEADSYKNGDEVALTVTPKSGYEVDSVKQDDKALTVGTDGKYKITVKDADVNVVITFKDKEVPPPAKTYTIGVACENGKYELSPAKEAYNEGDVVTLTVTPNEGYNLKSVTANGTALTAEADGSYKLTVAKANIDVVVTLEEEVEPPAPATYTVTVNCGENGTYALNPAKEAYEEGDEVKLTVTANEGYLVKSVKIGETALEAEADGSYKLTVGTENIVVAVEFEEEEPPAPTTYTISVTCDNGTYALDPVKEAYNEGDEVKLTVTANEGYILTSVTANGTALTAEADGSYKLTVAQENIAVVAAFEETVPVTKYEVKLDYDTTLGTVSLSPAATGNKYAENTEVTLTATPGEGNELKFVLIDGEEKQAEADGAYKFTVADKDVNVEVEFKKIPVDIWAGIGSGTSQDPFILNSLDGKFTFDYPGGWTRYIFRVNEENVEAGTYKLVSIVGKDGEMSDAKISSVTPGVGGPDNPNGTNLGPLMIGDTFTISTSYINLHDKELDLTKGYTKFSFPQGWMEDYIGPITITLEKVPTYNIAVECNDEQGSFEITPAKDMYFRRDEVTLKVKAKLGYLVKSVTANGIALTPAENGAYKLTVNREDINVVVTFEEGELPPVPGDNADVYVGDWEQDGTGYALNITKSEDGTTLAGKLTYYGSNAGTYTFVRVGSNEWFDQAKKYTLSYNDTDKTITFASSTVSRVMSKAEPPEPLNIPGDFHGEWISVGGSEYDVEYKAVISKTAVEYSEDGTPAEVVAITVEGNKLSIKCAASTFGEFTMIMVLADDKKSASLYLNEVSADWFSAKLVKKAEGMHIIEVKCDSQGTYTLSPVADLYAKDSEVILTVTPNEHYVVDTVKVNDEAIVAEADRTYKIVVTGDLKVAITFKVDGIWEELRGTFTNLKGNLQNVPFEEGALVVTINEETVILTNNGVAQTITEVSAGVFAGVKYVKFMWAEHTYPNFFYIGLKSNGEFRFDTSYWFTGAFKLKPYQQQEEGVYNVTVNYDTTKGTYRLDPAKDDYGEGDVVLLTVYPIEGYVVANATVNGKQLEKLHGAYIIHVGTENVVVEVTFRSKDAPAPIYTISVDSEHGQYLLDPNNEKFAEGDEVKLTVTPDAGYAVTSVSVNGIALTAEADGSYKLTVGNANINVVVTFEDLWVIKDYFFNTWTGETAKVEIAERSVKFYQGEQLIELKDLTVAETQISFTYAVEQTSFTMILVYDAATPDWIKLYMMEVSEDNLTDTLYREGYVPPLGVSVKVMVGDVETPNACEWKISPEKEAYEKDELITITLTPHPDYIIDSVKQMTRNGNLPCTKVSDLVYSFKYSGDINWIQINMQSAVLPDTLAGKWANPQEIKISGTIYPEYELVLEIGERDVKITANGTVYTPTKTYTAHDANYGGESVRFVCAAWRPGTWNFFIKDGAYILASSPYSYGQYAMVEYVELDPSTTFALNITCDETQGTCERSLIKDRYNINDEVTFTVKPKDGYAVKSVTANDKELTAEADRTYKITFTRNDIDLVISFLKKIEGNLWTYEGSGKTTKDPFILSGLEGKATVEYPGGSTKLYAKVPVGSFEAGVYKYVGCSIADVQITVTVGVGAPGSAYGKQANCKYIGDTFEINDKLDRYGDGSNIIDQTKGHVEISFPRNSSDFNNYVGPIELTFAKLVTHTVTVNCGENGKCELDPVKDTYEDGEKVKLTVTPNAGYAVDSITANGTALTAGEDSKYEITVTADTEVAVSFIKAVAENLWTRDGTGTADDPFIINGLTETSIGTFTVPHDGINANGNTNNRDWFKWTPVKPGIYTLKAVSGGGMGNDDRLKVWKNSANFMTGKQLGQICVGGEASKKSIEIKATDLVESLWFGLTFNVNEDCDISFTFKFEEKATPDTVADDYVGVWEDGKGFTVSIKKVSDTELSAKAVDSYGETSYKFIKNANNVWAGETAGYVMYDKATETIDFSDGTTFGQYTLTKKVMPEATAEDFVGTWVDANGTMELTIKTKGETALSATLVEGATETRHVFSKGEGGVWTDPASPTYSVQIDAFEGTLIFTKNGTPITLTKKIDISVFVGTWDLVNPDPYYGGELGYKFVIENNESGALVMKFNGAIIMNKSGEGVFTGTDGSNDYTLKYDKGNITLTVYHPVDDYSDLYALKKSTSEGLIPAKFHGEFENNAGKLASKDYAAKAIGLNVTAEKLILTIDGTEQALTDFMVWFDAGQADTYLKFKCAAIGADTYYIMVNYSGMVSMANNTDYVGEQLIFNVKSTESLAEELKPFIGNYTNPMMGDVVISQGATANTLNVIAANMQITMTLGADGAISGVSEMGQSFTLEQRDGKIILSMLNWAGIPQEYELTKAGSTEEGSIPELYRGNYVNQAGNLAGVDYAAGEFVVNVTANEFVIIVKGETQTITNAGVWEDEEYGDSYYRFDWNGTTLYTYVNTTYYIWDNISSCHGLTFDAKTEEPDVPDEPATIDDFVGTWNVVGADVTATIAKNDDSSLNMNFMNSNITLTLGDDGAFTGNGIMGGQSYRLEKKGGKFILSVIMNDIPQGEYELTKVETPDVPALNIDAKFHGAWNGASDGPGWKVVITATSVVFSQGDTTFTLENVAAAADGTQISFKVTEMSGVDVFLVYDDATGNLNLYFMMVEDNDPTESLTKA